MVAVKAANGTVGTVKLSYAGKDGKGKAVKGTVDGAMAKDKTGWTAGERLEPSATYTLSVTGTNPEGSRDHQEVHLHDAGAHPAAADLRPAPAAEGQQGRRGDAGRPDLRRGGEEPQGVREAPAVTTAPKQEGSWRWFSDKEVHFRPKSYWKPGTKVTATADLNGLDAGNGIYGQNSTSTSFTVGRSLITKINLDTEEGEGLHQRRAGAHDPDQRRARPAGPPAAAPS